MKKTIVDVKHGATLSCKGIDISVLKMYCEIAEGGLLETSWDAFYKYQEWVSLLREANKEL